MNLNKFAVAGFVIAALMLPSFGALAQETPAAPAAGAAAAPAEGAAAAPDPAGGEGGTLAVPGNADPATNWLKVCNPLADGKNACIMRQVLLVQGQFLGSFLLRDDPGQESRLFAVAAVPVGVLLPFSMLWQIDDGKPVRVPYILCDPVSCAAQTAVNEAYVNSLKKGGKLKLIAKTRQNKDLIIEINLAGFTATYDGEGSMTIEEFNKETTGAAPSGLEKTLQDKAEELRRELAAPPADPAAPAATPQ